MSTANKLLYLGETKSLLKDTINMSNANITNSTTFRNYATQLKEGYIDILNNGTDTLYNNFTHLTGKGNSLSLTPTYQAPMKITCYGSTSQASTPTPSSPVDVVTTTGNQSINVCGKNLFDETQLLNATGWSKNNDGYYNGTLSNYYSTFQNGFEFIIGFKENTQYTFKVNGYTTGGLPVIKFQYTDGTSVNLNISSTTATDYTYTTTEGKTLSKIIGTYGSGASNTLYLKNIQLEENNEATTYEAYNGTNYTIGLGDIELCKIGDYEDKIDKSTGKNLFNYNDLASKIQIFTINGNAESFTINGYGTYQYPISISTNEIISGSWSSTNLNGDVKVVYEDDTNANIFSSYSSTSVSGNISFIPTKNVKAIQFRTYGTNNITLNDFMINKGTTSLPYEPYGTDWYLKKNIGKVVLDGSESWNDINSNAVFFTNVSNALTISASTLPSMLSNYYTPQKYNDMYNGSVDYGVGLHSSNNRILIRNKDCADNTALQTWLSTHNTEVYYPLATPTYTKITDSTLIEQLEAIKSKDNTTNITSSMVIGIVALKKE